MINKETRKFLCSYYHDGSDWSMTIDAYDVEDAQARVKKLGFLRYDGEVIFSVSSNLGWFANLVCKIRNFLFQ